MAKATFGCSNRAERTATVSKYARLTLAHRFMVESMTLARSRKADLDLTTGLNWPTLTPNLTKCGGDTLCAKRTHRHAVTRAAVPMIVPLLDLRCELIGHVSR